MTLRWVHPGGSNPMGVCDGRELFVLIAHFYAYNVQYLLRPRNTTLALHVRTSISTVD